LWPDNQGVHINAHGGGILFHDGRYYWFGEHKIEGEAGNKAHVGVSCYSSADLHAWRNEGIALPVSDDPQSPITRGCVLERPKVLFCKTTGKFVMWFHLEPKDQGYRAANTGVAVSDTVTGPFTFLRAFRPNAGTWPINVPDEWKRPLSPDEETALAARKLGGGPVGDFPLHQVFRRDFTGGQMSRDMTLFLDDDGIAYHIHASENNGTLHIAQLTPDFLDFAGPYVRLFPGRFHEAPVMFKHAGKYFLITSDCTGWMPNPARLSVADAIFGPWTELGNLCVGPRKQTVTTFDSQSTHVLPVQGRPGAFIFMADRWRPKNAIDGRYVWLPVQFRPDGTPFLEWFDAWDLSFFDGNRPAMPPSDIETHVDAHVSGAFSLCVAKIRRSIQRLADEPKTGSLAPDGNYFAWPEGFFEIGNWTISFFTGMALWAYRDTRESHFLGQVSRLEEHYRAKVHEHAAETMHDLGFLYSLYSVALYKIILHPTHRSVGLRAAAVLADRFVTPGNFIRAWGRMDEQSTDYAGLAIVDCLMNLPLLFWASEESGDPRFREVAIAHADTALKTLVRADGSVCHAYRFDPRTGEPTIEANYCGRAVGSHWARGATWAFYGLAIAFRYTRDARYRDAAVRIAHTFLDNLDDELVPVWDFRLLPGEPLLRDSSAAAIAVCGLQELQRLGVADARFQQSSRQLLRRLCSEEYLDADLDTPGVLRNGQVGAGVGFAANAYTSWGDYFFMEALANELQLGESFW
jgi:hypothetical protein